MEMEEKEQNLADLCDYNNENLTFMTLEFWKERRKRMGLKRY